MASRQNENRAKLSWASAVYNPYALKQIDQGDLKKEYSRLRSIAQKRIKRIEASEWSDTKYTSNLPSLPKVRDLTDAQLRAKTSELARFISTKTSSVSGLNRARRNAVRTLGRRYPELEGVVTEKNWREFGEFMEYARELHQGRMYDSERVADWFAENGSKEDLADAFIKWMEDNANHPGKLQAGVKTSSEVFRA